MYIRTGEKIFENIFVNWNKTPSLVPYYYGGLLSNSAAAGSYIARRSNLPGELF